MRNPSAKKVSHAQNGGDKKPKKNYYMKKELIKIMFKKNDKISQVNKSKNAINLQKNQTRNHINSKNKDNNKYTSNKSNNLNSVEKAQAQTKENNNYILTKNGKNNLTQKLNKPNMLLFNQYNNTQKNERKNIKIELKNNRPNI